MSNNVRSVEEFLLDPSFKNWILYPDDDSRNYWEQYIIDHPTQIPNIEISKSILINMSVDFVDPKGQLIADTWEQIEKRIDLINKEFPDQSIIAQYKSRDFLHETSKKSKANGINRFYKTLLVLTLIVSLVLINKFWSSPAPVEATAAVQILEEHEAVPGEKSLITLADGSTVLLNSGSKIHHVKDFDSHERLVELTGEAFFEVAKDVNRPFIVKSNQVSIKAIGTSFNIKNLENSEVEIFLFTGLIEVNAEWSGSKTVELVAGEKIKVSNEKKSFIVDNTNPDLDIAWTKDTIILENTPIMEAAIILENWFGVHIHLLNEHPKDLSLSGKFVNQSLENVLEGLSYLANFQYDINQKTVSITFDHQKP